MKILPSEKEKNASVMVGPPLTAVHGPDNPVDAPVPYPPALILAMVSFSYQCPLEVMIAPRSRS